MRGSQLWGVFQWQEPAGLEPTGSRAEENISGKIRKEKLKER